MASFGNVYNIEFAISLPSPVPNTHNSFEWFNPTLLCVLYAQQRIESDLQAVKQKAIT